MPILAYPRGHLAVLTGAALALAAAVTPAGASVHRSPAADHAAGQAGLRAGSTVDGLQISVGYAEDKEINTPDPAAFPVPWNGSPDTTFLGSPVPGQSACGSLPACYDTGAIRLDNPTAAAVKVTKVSVNMHSSVKGGTFFANLWGSFTVQPGKSVVLAANPPHNDPSYDNFDTSGFPANNCTPVTVAPKVIITIAGVTTTLADSTHVLDTGGIDEGFCPPKQNESIQWRPIGTPGTDDGSLTLGPATATAPAGHPVTETATLLDGSGKHGLPNALVKFKVTSGPDAGSTATVPTDAGGKATFTLPGAGQGEDVVTAGVTTVGTIQSGQSRVMWTDGSAAGWSSADVGSPAIAGGQSFDAGTGTWTVSGSGTGLGGPADQFHFAGHAAAGSGIEAHVASQSAGGSSAEAGVMLRAGPAAGAPYYGAFVSPSGAVTVRERSSQGGGSTTVATGTAGQDYLWLTDSGGSLTAYQSADGYDWQPVAGSTVSLDLGSSRLGGLAVTSGNPAVLNTATLTGAALPSGPPGPALPVPCPAPWTCADIGNPAPAGSQSFDPNTSTWTIGAGGSDITGPSDQFRYVWQALSGDGSVIAHVTSQGDTSSAAKAGVMFRTSTDPGAPNYAVLVSPGQGIKVQLRRTLDGNTAKLANPAGTTPAYLKITKSGNTYTAYTSANGTTWTLIPGSATTVSLGGPLLAGLAVTSHSNGTLCTVTMDDVSVG